MDRAALREAFYRPFDSALTQGEVVVAAGLAALLILLLWTMAAGRAPREGAEARDTWPGWLAAWLGIRQATPLASLVLALVMLAFAGLFVLAIVTSYFLIWGAISSAFDSESSSPALGLGALLVALLGAPFLIWRTVVGQKTLEATQRQTDLQDEALFNDKINAAATNLAARRQVTRVVEQDGKDVVLTEWQDDLVTRAAAIDRLEGLALEAMERGDFAPAQRIARMLSIYVQELSREHPAKESPKDIWDKMAENTEDSEGMHPEAIFSETGIHPDETTHAGIRAWANRLSDRKRPDMERAVQSLGRINPRDEAGRAAFHPTNIDLRRCNLQGMNLRRLTFVGGLFDGAWIQGADLSLSKFQDALLIDAQMQGAVLIEAELQRAFLGGARMQGADLRSAQLQEARFNRADMQGADLSFSQLQEALLIDAQMQGADLGGAQMQRANLGMAQMQGANLGGSQLQETDLSAADMKHVKLGSAQMSEDTNLSVKSLYGAEVRNVDAITIHELRPFWDVIFADGTLREHVTDEDWPAHWPREILEYHDTNGPSEFEIGKRKWLATLPPEDTPPD